MRLVVDTNLMIRSLLSPGPARQFFRVAPLTHQLLYHPEQLSELRDVASRPRLKIAAEAVTELVERIERYGHRADCDLNVKLDCRDPKDDYVLALALAGTASFSQKTMTCWFSIRGAAFASCGCLNFFSNIRCLKSNRESCNVRDHSSSIIVSRTTSSIDEIPS